MDRALFYTAIGAAALYLVTIPWHPFPGDAALKGLAVSPLAILAARRLTGKDQRLLSGALGLSVIGDVLLALGDNLFLYGLVAFLLAHLVYINLFRHHWAKPVVLPFTALPGMLLLLIWSGFVTVLLVPKLGMMGPAVSFYIGAVTAMATCSFLVTKPTKLIWIGAVLFVISDSILGINKFHSPVPMGSYLVWATYFFAQLALTFGFIQTPSREVPANPRVDSTIRQGQIAQ